MPTPKRPGRADAYPRTAFCFHDPAPSGASVWLRDFLLCGKYPHHRMLAVLPAPSPIEEALYRDRVPIRIVAVRTGALSKAPLSHVVPMLLNRASIIRQYRELFRRERVELVYTNSSFQIAPMIAARLERIPLLVHVHEGWHMGMTHALKTFMVRRLAKTVVFAADAGRKLFSPEPSGTCWAVSPNGVPSRLAELGERRSELREALGFAPGDRVFLFLGTLGQRKGFHDLLAVWPAFRRRYPSARLIAAGGTDPSETDPAIIGFLEHPPAGAEYWGYRNDAHELLAAADCFVLPSYGEAMPISVSEAMMIGTPIVARAVGDIPWQIGDGRGFLFRGDGPKGLLREMRRAISNPDIAHHRALLAQDFAHEHLTRGKQYRQIRALIRQTTRPGRTPMWSD